jgi:hypothetical protein
VPKGGEKSKDGTHSTQVAVAWIGVLGLVLAAAVTALLTGGFGLLADDKASPATTATAPTVRADGGNSANRDTCVSGGVVVEGDVNCTKTLPKPSRPAATTADAGCGSFEDAPAGVRLRLKVVMWCAPKAVRGQYQYKLKVLVKNTGKSRLDIRRERFVLLWRTLNPIRWSPPPAGAPSPPRKVQYRDRDYWAISANLEGVAEPLPDRRYATFATHWSHTSLAPGQRSLRPKKNGLALRYQDRDGTLKTIRFNYHEDDLVFYVPVATVNRDRNFLGLAYHDGHRVIALCPQDKWGPKVPPNAF